MFDLYNHPSIITHLKNISSICRNRGNETEIFCQYCNDATRKSNPDHGHLYISNDKPVFICFKCNTAGSLIKLLIDTNFLDYETLNYLKSISKYNYINSSFNFKQNNNQNTLKRNIANKIVEFKSKYNQNTFNVFNRYIIQRLGNINYQYFNMYPEIINNQIGINFINASSNLVTTRFITNSNYRYKHYNNIYYFQNIDTIYKYPNIIFTEGVFDIINLYLYNDQFSNKDTFYISICGKKYISTLRELLYNRLLLTTHNIHFIFDVDNYYNENYKKIGMIKYANKLCKFINSNVSVIGYNPTLSKDTGECPIIEEVIV